MVTSVKIVKNAQNHLKSVMVTSVKNVNNAKNHLKSLMVSSVKTLKMLKITDGNISKNRQKC